MATHDGLRTTLLLLDRRHLHVATPEDAVPVALGILQDSADVVARFGHIRLSEQMGAAIAVLRKRLARSGE